MTQLIKKRLYIDDLILSVNGVDRAIKTRQITSDIFEKTAMTMTKLLSLNNKVLQSIPERNRAPIEDMNFNIGSDEKMLISMPTKLVGMVWKAKQDEFFFERYKYLAQHKKYQNSLLVTLRDS